ncbi:hypothetical protein PYCC9005_001379 [Savitreella phatthalungensis]
MLHMDRVDLSNLIGAVSLSFWLCNGIPLVLEIYKRGSADGVALGFVLLWTIGDVLNLAGSIWAGLVPGVIFVACYYILSDLVILGEALYFGSEEPMTLKTLAGASDDFEQIVDVPPADISPLTRPRRRTMDEQTPLIVSAGPAELYNLENDSGSASRTVLREIVTNTAACIGVALLGVVGWYASTWLGGRQTSRPTADVMIQLLKHTKDKKHVAVGPQILGYTSAALYLLARVPQIVKNYRKRRTDGLALLFFIFSVMGNLTYAASILVYSSGRNYLLTNVPWLLGSLGTLVFDFVILGQFLLYRNADPLDDDEEDEGERSLLST